MGGRGLLTRAAADIILGPCNQNLVEFTKKKGYNTTFVSLAGSGGAEIEGAADFALIW